MSNTVDNPYTPSQAIPSQYTVSAPTVSAPTLSGPTLEPEVTEKPQYLLEQGDGFQITTDDPTAVYNGTKRQTTSDESVMAFAHMLWGLLAPEGTEMPPEVQAFLGNEPKTPQQPSKPREAGQPIDGKLDGDNAYTHKRDPLFPPEGPKVTDVRQGDLGDCYALSGITSVLNANPELIQKNIKTNPNGGWDVQLYTKDPAERGKMMPETVHVDPSDLSGEAAEPTGSSWAAVYTAALTLLNDETEFLDAGQPGRDQADGYEDLGYG
ncbi:MAG TPA: hypothetical protein VFH51_05720, partial [Myxococcota bacterium]|nr:hypothetical protein [Myxococcota bacterium]